MTPYEAELATYFWPGGAPFRLTGEAFTAAENAFKAGFEAGWDAREKSATDTLREFLGTGNLAFVGPEQIYAAYPLKVGKQAALKAIKKAQADTHIGYPKLLEATQAFAAAVKDWPEADKKFIPHPATWFNRGSYDDDQSSWQKGKPVYQSQFSTSH